jgi:hypothetical protein
MTEDGMEVIAAGVSELGAKTTVKIWASKPAPTLGFDPRLVDVNAF